MFNLQPTRWMDEQIEIFNQQDIQTSLNTLGEIPETENEYSIELGRIDFCDKGEEYTVPLCIRFIK